MAESKDIGPIIDALGDFIETLVEAFGPIWTLTILFLFILAIGVLIIYFIWSKGAAFREFVKQSNAQLDRIAEENRYLRYMALIKDGWDKDEAHDLIYKNERPNRKEGEE